jgi:hypothetical protein
LVQENTIDLKGTELQLPHIIQLTFMDKMRVKLKIFLHFCHEVIMLHRYAGRKSLLASILHLPVVVLHASNFKPVLFILPHTLHKWFQLVRQYRK